MASEPKDYTIFMILTSNTEVTENKVQFFNLAYRVKGFQCHSNNSLQLLGRNKTTTTTQYSGTSLQRPCLGSSLLTLVESLAAFRVYFLL